MKMNWKKVSVVAGIGAALLLTTALVVFSQQPPGPPREGRGFHGGPGGPGGPREFGPFGPFGRDLNLTDDQKAQAKQIFGDARTASQPLRQQLRDARQQLAADVKSNAPENVLAKDSSAVGSLVSQMTTIRAKAMQQFYGTLTAEQKAKADEMKAQRQSRSRGPRG